jgi:hypothetical protein
MGSDELPRHPPHYPDQCQLLYRSSFCGELGDVGFRWQYVVRIRHHSEAKDRDVSECDSEGHQYWPDCKSLALYCYSVRRKTNMIA